MEVATATQRPLNAHLDRVLVATAQEILDPIHMFAYPLRNMAAHGEPLLTRMLDQGP